jgi:dipeptidyl aminopeptidase/acylaminoacyl peptidase
LTWAAFGALLILGVAAAAWTLSSSRTQPVSEAASAPLERVTLAPTTVDQGYEGEPTFSPDGQTIAYVSDRTGNFEIFLKQVTGGPDINLTNNPADDMQPSFSPDGKQIAFVSSRSGEYNCLCFFLYGTEQPLMGGAIWVMPALGGSPRRIVESGTFPSWSPDGSAIIYSSGPWHGQRIYRAPLVVARRVSNHLFERPVARPKNLQSPLHRRHPSGDSDQGARRPVPGLPQLLARRALGSV